MTGPLPRLSVVVPSFNQGRFLGQALDSIFQQDYPDLEVLLLDAGSTDETAAVIRHYEPRLTFWRSAADGGQAAAINEGVRRATGDLVAWLNSDDFYWGDSLWTVARAFGRFPGRSLYVGNGVRYDQSTGRSTLFCPRHLALNRRALVRGLDYLLQPSVFFLRTAWQAEQGLDEQLRYCMDWDLILRMARAGEAVLINECLSASREHDETKTSAGRLPRAEEIARMIRRHSDSEVTPGTLFYLFETVLGMSERAGMGELHRRTHEGIFVLRQAIREDCGNTDGFPEQGDPQDHVYLPLALEAPRVVPPTRRRAPLPSISLVTPSFNQAAFLPMTLESVRSQGYPCLEHLVYDGGSTDGSVDVLKKYESGLAHWVSRPDRGPASAINEGLRRATGDVVGWLASDDMLAEGALEEVGRAFAGDPELDVVYGNALYVDENNGPFPADHGAYRTAFYRGEWLPRERIPGYWTYVHSVPQPTVFFKRRLLEECGFLDESYHFIFDFELFFRFTGRARVKKIERTQAFYRIHTGSKSSDFSSFLVELYRFSRPWWAARGTPAFRQALDGFVPAFLARQRALRPGTLRHAAAKWAVRLSAYTGVGNPERWPRQKAWKLLCGSPPAST
jgi:glycosyltransferase involved in cell wall biosynthesis